jgi:hypothetical protein
MTRWIMAWEVISRALKSSAVLPLRVAERNTAMSTESTRIVVDPARQPEAAQLAANLGKQAAAGTDVDIRCVGAEDGITRSTQIESYPYSSFEQGGVRRFERSPFTRGPFAGSGDLPPFRVS